jgi:hypothetical protein
VNFPSRTLLDFQKQRRSNNVSGVPGVHFHKTPPQPLGFWHAAIRFHDGKRRTRTFSVLKHGDRKAYGLAVAARSDLLAQVSNRPYLTNSVAKRLSERSEGAPQRKKARST